MNRRTLVALVVAFSSVPGFGAVVENTTGPRVQLWRDPGDIPGRDLYYGPGGKRHAPGGGFAFVEEDREGSSPKFTVDDKDGVKWKVKLGPEAQPETAATRLAWGVGYFTDEDYLVPVLRVVEMPAKLHRGQSLIRPDGTMLNARLERHPEGRKKLGNWEWRDNPFYGSREFNGLRVIMALLNNWDLKDVNNAIYGDKQPDAKQTYVVADLGATFGAPGFAHPVSKSRNNLTMYTRSKFISRVTPDYVDFSAPAKPALIRWVDPPDYIKRLKMRWIGRHIPRGDAKWIGQLLARLSRRQITDAFRAAGYSPAEVEAFTATVQSRIAELNTL
jgi:hypothetical protein